MHERAIMVLAMATLSALATGLGALPVLWWRRGGLSPGQRAGSSALAAGMMLAASVESLAGEALRLPGGVLPALLGMALGGLLITGLRVGSRSRLLFLVMLLHSIPEGVALGVGFAAPDVKLGWLVAGVLCLHNIPEGIAVSLALAGEGAGFWRCFWASVLTSLPQPVLALPAFWLAWHFRPLLPWGLGLAAGAMIYVTVRELLPHDQPELAARGALAGVVLFLGISQWLNSFTL